MVYPVDISSFLLRAVLTHHPLCPLDGWLVQRKGEIAKARQKDWQKSQDSDGVTSLGCINTRTQAHTLNRSHVCVVVVRAIRKAYTPSGRFANSILTVQTKMRRRCCLTCASIHTTTHVAHVSTHLIVGADTSAPCRSGNQPTQAPGPQIEISAAGDQVRTKGSS